MKFKQTLNELKAEITKVPRQDKVPMIHKNKIFIGNKSLGYYPPEWKSVLSDIWNKLKNLGLLKSFEADADPLDISGHKPEGDIDLKSDTGDVYIYNVEDKTLYDSNRKKIG